MKTTSFDLRLLRRFSKFRALEEQCRQLSECCEKQEKLIVDLEKKAASDKALIESLNRYIAMLERKSKGQSEQIQELKDRFNKQLEVPGSQKEAPQ